MEKYPFESSSFHGNLDDWDYEDANKQTNCPFAAHIRKTNPRIGIGNDTKNLMMRRGIPYGPVWEPGKNDDVERGLLFTCYQSAIKNGFQFVMNRKQALSDRPRQGIFNDLSRVGVQPRIPARPKWPGCHYRPGYQRGSRGGRQEAAPETPGQEGSGAGDFLHDLHLHQGWGVLLYAAVAIHPRSVGLALKAL